MATADKSQTKAKKKIRAARGAGRLYKRDLTGREYPATSKTPGVFWIQYTIGTKISKTGKEVPNRIRHCLTGKDGKPITDLRQAEAERRRLTAPLRAGHREEQLKSIAAALTQAGTDREQAEEAARPVLPLCEAWEAYLRSPDRPDTGPDTLRYYHGYFSRFEKWLNETAPDVQALRDIGPELASGYAATLNGETASPNTFNKHTAFLKLFFKVLHDAAGMQSNPFEKIRRKNLKTNTRRELTLAELKEILETATGDLQTLLCIGTFTGLRMGDCCCLKWGEVDLHRGLIKRIPNKTKKSGKPVLIGIPEALHVKLSETPPDRRKGYVLPRFAELYTYRNASGRPTRQADISNEIQAHLEACGIQTHKDGTGQGTGKRAVVEVGFHSLRHTWVSMHAAAGTPQAVIQNVIGHSNPAMTAHYTHVNEETARRTAGVLTLNEPNATDREPVPDWALELLNQMTAKNWKKILKVVIGKE